MADASEPGEAELKTSASLNVHLIRAGERPPPPVPENWRAWVKTA